MREGRGAAGGDAGSLRFFARPLPDGRVHPETSNVFSSKKPMNDGLVVTQLAAGLLLGKLPILVSTIPTKVVHSTNLVPSHSNQPTWLQVSYDLPFSACTSAVVEVG